MLTTTPALSHANLKSFKSKSLARAKPSLHAIASIVSGSKLPSITTAEDPKKRLVKSRAIAAATTLPKLLAKAASTLIFVSPDGGGIHRVELL
jgi:hypothetical protein